MSTKLERMYHISVFWQNDSDELLLMLDKLGDPGATVGNDGCELVVNKQEYLQIASYAADYPHEITFEEKGTLMPSEAEAMIKEWASLE